MQISPVQIVSGSIAVAFSLPIEIDFIASHPFHYVIANEKDLAPLFSGRVADFWATPNHGIYSFVKSEEQVFCNYQIKEFTNNRKNRILTINLVTGREKLRHHNHQNIIRRCGSTTFMGFYNEVENVEFTLLMSWK